MAAAELSLAEDVAACLEKFLEHIQPIPARVQGGLGRVRQLDEVCGVHCSCVFARSCVRLSSSHRSVDVEFVCARAPVRVNRPCRLCARAQDSVGVLHRVAALEEKYLAHTRKQAQKRRVGCQVFRVETARRAVTTRLALHLCCFDGVTQGSVLIDIKDAKRCRRRLAEIETERNTAVLMAAEKIQLTTQLYELVDARIQQLGKTSGVFCVGYGLCTHLVSLERMRDAHARHRRTTQAV